MKRKPDKVYIVSNHPEMNPLREQDPPSPAWHWQYMNMKWAMLRNPFRVTHRIRVYMKAKA